MIPVTNQTKTALQQAVKQVRAQISWAVSADDTETLTSEDKIISIKKEAEGYYCKSTLRKITIVLAGTDTSLLDYRVTALVQVKTGANSWGNIPWGSFTITEEKIDQEKGISTFTGYGGIAMMQNREYQQGSLTFPTTVAGLAQQIADLFALTIDTDMTTLPNYNAPIAEDLWAKISGTTYRDILEEIAGATGTIAVIGGGDDALDFKLPPVNAATETLTESNLITSKIGENWGKVSAVVLSRQPQGDNIEVTDPAIINLPTGKNLASLIGTTSNGLTTSTSGSDIVVSGTASDNWAFGTDATEETLVAGTYTISVTDQLTHSVDLRVYYEDETSDTFQIAAGSTSQTFTLNDDAVKYQLLFGGLTVNTQYNESFSVQIETGSTATTYEPYKANGRVDLVITNNQILDPQRETTATPILNAVKGWEYRNSEIKTEGHGYHEVGDRIDITVAGATHTIVVTKSSILVDGGINETLTSTTPEVVTINYAKSGGITKTIFNTELAVDKQEQRIDSIVSRQDNTDAMVASQFTQVTQNLTEIVSTVQSTGGGNFIRNSVGFGKDSNGILTNWTYGTGASNVTVRSQSSPASLNAGAVSGYEIMVTGATISQDLNLTPGETYTLALRAQKGSVGGATITVGNSSETATITLANGTAYAWQRQSVEFTPTMGANAITITSDAGTTVEITDLILTTGGAITWRQASGEIYNTQVSLDQAGVQVRSSVYTGDYVEITPLEFAGYSNASGSMQKVFSLNRDITEVEKLEARSQIKMPPLKIVPVNNASYSGWAFVKEQ